jgi:hypothetical protein
MRFGGPKGTPRNRILHKVFQMSKLTIQSRKVSVLWNKVVNTSSHWNIVIKLLISLIHIKIDLIIAAALKSRFNIE